MSDSAAGITDRCPWAIRFGLGRMTRCDKDSGHVDSHVDTDAEHQGPGLAQFPGQRVSWFAGDRREVVTDRVDMASWESWE